MKLKELRPDSRRVFVDVTVKETSSPREVSLKTGERATVADITVEDDSGTATLTLWNELATKVKVGDKLKIENGYVSTFRGEMRLNVGKYGKLSIEE